MTGNSKFEIRNDKFKSLIVPPKLALIYFNAKNVYFFKLIRSSFGQSSFRQMYLEEAKSEHLSRFAQSRRAEAHLKQRFKASAAASIRGHVQNVSKE